MNMNMKTYRDQQILQEDIPVSKYNEWINQEETKGNINVLSIESIDPGTPKAALRIRYVKEVLQERIPLTK